MKQAISSSFFLLLLLSATTTFFVTVTAQDDTACTVCPANSQMSNTDQELILSEGTCGQLQTILDPLPEIGCQAIFDNLPVDDSIVDIQSFCGCTNVEVPNLCKGDDTLCSSHGGGQFVSSDNPVTVPGLGISLSCNQAVDLAPSLTSPTACDALAQLCCSTPENEEVDPTPVDDPGEEDPGADTTTDTDPYLGDDTACTVCGEGSTMTNPNRPLILTDGTCGELQTGLTILPDDAACESLTGQITQFVDVASFCGCSNAQTPNVCASPETICGVAHGGDGVLSTEDQQVTVPGVGISLNCNQASDVIPYLTVSFACDLLAELCCVPSSDPDTPPDEPTSGTDIDEPQPFLCSICPAGSTMGNPDQQISVLYSSCGLVEQGLMSMSEDDCIVTTLSSFIDLASWCGCSGYEQEPAVCEVCEGSSLTNLDTQIDIPTFGTFNCEQGAEIAKYMKSLFMCNELQTVFDPVCCGVVDTTPGEEPPVAPPADQPDDTPPAVEEPVDPPADDEPSTPAEEPPVAQPPASDPVPVDDTPPVVVTESPTEAPLAATRPPATDPPVPDPPAEEPDDTTSGAALFQLFGGVTSGIIGTTLFITASMIGGVLANL